MPDQQERTAQPAVQGMSFKLSPDQSEKVKSEASLRGVSVSRLIRDALKENIGDGWPT